MIHTDGNPTIANSHGARKSADLASAALELAQKDAEGWRASYMSLLHSWSGDQDRIADLEQAIGKEQSCYRAAEGRIIELECNVEVLESDIAKLRHALKCEESISDAYRSRMRELEQAGQAFVARFGA